MSALADLTDTQEMVLLAYLHEGTMRGAARVLGMPIRTVKYHLETTRRALGVERSRDLLSHLIANDTIRVEVVR